MNKQSQWLFEAPLALEADPYSRQEHYGNRELEAEWELGQDEATFEVVPWQTAFTRQPVQRAPVRSVRATAVPGTATPLVLTYSDVRNERIDVFAQRALLRMSKNPNSSTDAAGMADEVKAGRLAGIYKEDEQVPALRAKKMNLGWWQLIPQGEDAALVLDPTNPMVSPPLIVFRNQVRSLPHRLDPALLKVWQTYKLWQMGRQTGKVVQCAMTTPDGWLMARPSLGTPISNLTPSVLCITETGLADCPPNPIGKRCSFSEMWKMIICYYYQGLRRICQFWSCEDLFDIFTPELLIAIFWEETRFENKLQVGGGLGISFGQVQPEGIRMGCKLCELSMWKRQEISPHINDEKGVQITGMYLFHLFCSRKSGTKQDRKDWALKAYAGWFPGQKPENFKGSIKEWQQKRQSIINGWLACEKHLRSRHTSNTFVDKQFLVHALKMATIGKPAQTYNESTDGDIVFPPGQPLPDLRYTI